MKKKSYKYLQIIFLVLSIYVILFPIIIAPITEIIPQFRICPYLRMTGKPCPLCGGTRYIANIFQVLKDPSYLIHPFGIIVICLLFEIIFRIWLLCRKKYNKKIIQFDITYHITIIILFIIYEISFLINN